MKLFLAGMLFVMLSCSNNSESLQSTQNESTSIRSLVEETKGSIKWTVESMNDVSSNDAETNNWAPTSIVDFRNVDDSTLFLHHYDLDRNIYPRLEGFGSLDTENITENLSAFIVRVVDSVKKKYFEDEFFTENTQYLRTIIEYEIKDLPVINNYIIGSAFVFDNPRSAYEIPIRLFFEEGYANCFLYCRFVDDSYKIEQFDIGTLQNE